MPLPGVPPESVLVFDLSLQHDVVEAVFAKRRGVRLVVAELVLNRFRDDSVVTRREAVVVDNRLREDLRRDNWV